MRVPCLVDGQEHRELRGISAHSRFLSRKTKVMKRKRKFGVVAALVLLLALTGIAVRGVRAQSTGNPASAHTTGPKTAVEQFKNIQVLKDVPADQLIPAMQFITSSLGVGCDFCHVENAFEKDDKKTKVTARKMMEMMITINSENFDNHREVTCFTCHRGRSMPVGIPPVMGDELKVTADAGRTEAHTVVEIGEGASGEAKKAAGPTSDQLIDKYLKAVGGADAINQVTSRVMKGTITFGDRNIPIDIFSKDPDKRVSFAHTPDGDSITAFDGHEGWLGVPKRPVREMHGPDIDAAAMDADLHFAAHLKSMFSKAEVRGMERIGDDDAYLVIGQREGKTPLNLYFDRQSGLLVRLVRFGDTPLGQLPTQIDYADYREAGAVRIPFRWTLARPGGRFTIQVTEVKQNVPVYDAKFAKPPAPPEAQKSSAK